LLILAVFCEEHLTKDLHRTLNNVAKAIDIELTSHHEHEHLKVFDQIEQVLCLMAKFVDPATYLRLVRPRMSEDSVHMQRSFVVILSSLIKGASFHRLCPHWIELLSLVSSPNDRTLEELKIDSEEENVLALSKECLDRLHVLSKAFNLSFTL
jgi:hypothetical protein